MGDPRADRRQPAQVLPDLPECSVQVDDVAGIVAYVPLWPRPDKTTPNTERVIERTIATIRDGVTLRELVA